MKDTTESWTAARDGMARAEAGADRRDPEFKTVAFSAVRSLALAREFLDVDDVWKLIGSRFPSTKFGSALGPVMRRARKEGIISGPARYAYSDRAVTHAVPRRIWRSEVYGRS